MSRSWFTLLLGLITVSSATAQVEVTARVTVRLPRDARLFVDEVFCPLPGEVRAFDTPPLDRGRKYFYTLTVEINHEGKPVRVSKRAILEAGKTTEVDFGTRLAILAAATPAKEETPPVADVPLPLPPLPQAPPMQPATAVIKGDKIEIKHFVFAVEYAEKVREVEKDGKKVPETYKVAKHVMKAVSATRDLKGQKTVDGMGRSISEETLGRLLAKESAVLLASGDKVDAFYLHSLKPSAIILLESPGDFAAPKTPVPEPKPVPVEPKKISTEDVTGDPPRLIQVKLEGGFLVWEDGVTLFKEVEKTVKQINKDGNEVDVKVKELVAETKQVSRKVEAARAKIVTVGGKSINADDLPSRIKGQTPILLTEGTQTVDPFHVQLYDAETLVLILPMPIAAPLGDAPMRAKERTEP